MERDAARRRGGHAAQEHFSIGPSRADCRRSRRPECAGAGEPAYRRTGRCHGRPPMFVPAPGLVSSPALRRALVRDASIGDVMKSWKELDLALVGIGSLEPSPLLRQSGNALTEAEQDQLRNAGAVGDVCLRFFDVNGVTVKTSLDERVMSITPADLMQVPRRVGVAGGASKYLAIRAALRGAWVNVLVTDLDTARGLVEDTEARPADLLSAEGLGASCSRLRTRRRSPQAQPCPGRRKHRAAVGLGWLRRLRRASRDEGAWPRATRR